MLIALTGAKFLAQYKMVLLLQEIYPGKLIPLKPLERRNYEEI